MNYYAKASRQHINYNKRKYNFFNSDQIVIERVMRILVFQYVVLPATYLGLPLISKKPNNNYWNYIIEIIQNKLARWKGKLLSQAGKLQFCKAYLQNILVYYMSLFKIPTFIVDKIKQIQMIFLWTRTEECNRIDLVGWGKVCAPK